MAQQAMMSVPDEGSWRTANFRQNMVSKIEEAISQCRTPTNKNAAEMENQVYSKANSKNEYLSFVARLILHIKEIGKPKAAGPEGPGGNQMGGPMGGQQNIAMMNQMNPNMMGHMNQGMGPGMGQPGHGQVMGGMNQQQGGMNGPQQPGGIAMQQQGGQMNMQQQGGQMNMQQQSGGIQVGGMMGPQGAGVGMMNQQGPGGMMGQQQVRMMASQGPNSGMMGQPGGGMMQQGGMSGGMNINMQQSQQGQQQNQMLNPNQNFLNQQQQQIQQQMQNVNIGNQGQMSGPTGGMNNAQMQQALLQQQNEQQQQSGGRMRMPMQQMQHMPRKGLQARPMNPNAMGIPSRPEHGPNYSMNRLNYFGSQQADGGMPNQFAGGPQMQRPGVPFMPPNASSMGSGPTPSPNSMNQGQNQGFINSPQPLHPHGSPAPGIRPFGNQMVPSPSTNVNTPMPMVPTPSPRNAEELACMKKIEELRRYTDMIQRMIVKIGNEDTEKSSKMKKLLEILLQPSRQVSMELLLKCEIALKKMEKQQHETGPPSQPTVPPKDQISPFLQLQEAILTTLKNGSSSHTFLRTFRPSIEALTGQSAICPELSDDMDATLNDAPKSVIPPVLSRELKLMGRRFPVTIQNRGRKLPLRLNASIGDHKLPRVPFLKVVIPVEYPDESPIIIDFKKDYSSTPFLSSIAQAFRSRKMLLPNKYSIYELLISWEMSVRQVANPIICKKPVKRLSAKAERPVSSTRTVSKRLGLPFI